MGSSTLLWALGAVGVVFALLNFVVGLFGAGIDSFWIGANLLLGVVLLIAAAVLFVPFGSWIISSFRDGPVMTAEHQEDRLRELRPRLEEILDGTIAYVGKMEPTDPQKVNVDLRSGAIPSKD